MAADRGSDQFLGAVDFITIGVGGDRVRMFNLASSEGPRFAKIAQEMTDQVRELGPNPIKLAARRRAA